MSGQLAALPLTERYRPATWAEVVGQQKAVDTVLRLKARNAIAGKAYWISGASGTGKTTMARLIALEVADEFAIQELDSQWLTPARIQELEGTLSIRGWGDKGGHAIIVNEAHRINDKAVTQLLTALEPVPSHVAWIFTTTTEAQEGLFAGCLDAAPLLSRCTKLPLARRDLAKAFAERAREIAQREGLDGQPLEKYLRLVQDNKNNMRAVLQAIESGEMLDAAVNALKLRQPVQYPPHESILE